MPHRLPYRECRLNNLVYRYQQQKRWIDDFEKSNTALIMPKEKLMEIQEKTKQDILDYLTKPYVYESLKACRI